MSFAVAVVIMLIVTTGFHFVFHTLAGDESKLAKGDERQKKLARDATMTSWYCMMYWILIKMLALIPFLRSVILPESPFSQSAFVQHGGDILIVAVAGYVCGYLISYFRYSA
jgi:hypothetical protein